MKHYGAEDVALGRVLSKREQGLEFHPQHYRNKHNKLPPTKTPTDGALVVGMLP
jgi:hypothetical protein